MIRFLTLEKHWPLKVVAIPAMAILAILTLAARNQGTFEDEQFTLFGFFFLTLPIANGYYLKKLFLDNMLLIVYPFRPRKKVFQTILIAQILACVVASLTVTLSSIAISRQFPSTTTTLSVVTGMTLGLLLVTTAHTVVFLIFKNAFIAYFATISGLIAIYVAAGGMQPTVLHLVSPLHLIEKLAVQLRVFTVISAIILSSLSLIITERAIRNLSLGEDL